MVRPTFPDDPDLRRFVMIYVCVLAAIAGFINSTLLVDLVYPVSHVSGSLTHFSMDVVEGDLPDLEQLMLILLGFFAGAVLGGAIIGGTETETGRRYGGALLIEAGLLAAAPLLDGAGLKTGAMIAAASACGLQNAMFSNYRGLVLRTTHFTGTLTDLGALIGRSTHKRTDVWFASVLVLTMLFFVIGGALGAVNAIDDGTNALYYPAGVCALLGIAYFTYHHRRAAADPETDKSDHELESDRV